MSPDSHQTLAEVITQSMPKEGSKPPPPELHEKCPRCDSPNTKFCYYNNYNLSQPRHYCKACRRYWTKGGALRNVPIGGGCRKTRQMKQISNSNNHNSSYERNVMECNGEGLNFSLGFLNPAMDFQLDSNSMFPISSFSNYNTIMPSYYSNHSTYTSQLTSGRHQSSVAVATLMTGFDGTYETKSISDINSSMTVHTNLASYIESLSFINQELHWMLQQQRLAALLSENHSENPSTQTEEPSIIRKGANGGGRNNIMIKEFFDRYYPANG